MNITEAYLDLEENTRDIEEMLNKKEELLKLVNVQAIDYSKEKIKSNLRVDRYAIYYSEIPKIDSVLDYLYREREMLLEFIDKQLKLINEYDSKKDKVAYYRCIGKTFDEIASILNCPKTTCFRMYREYLHRRDIWDEYANGENCSDDSINKIDV